MLDPACGSGNFLYLALITLKDIEQRVILEAEMMGLETVFPSVGPEAVKGIEINPYAAELARVTIWIGQIQWMLRHGFNLSKNPILKPLNQIECRDALLNTDGSENEWPEADFIIGNPPFLGDKKMIGVLGENATLRLRAVYAGKVPGSADLVTYWFEKASALMARDKIKRAGFVSTNSIRGGSNRRVLDKLLEHAKIFNAWSDEAWVVEGAAVRVSIVCFGSDSYNAAILDGHPVNTIHADLTASTDEGGINATQARSLNENSNIGFIGTQKSGNFNISGELARNWLQAPSNPNGKLNNDVIRPWINGLDITRRNADTWIVDFGVDISEKDASLYEMPYQYIFNAVKKNIEAKQVKWHAEGKSTKHLDKQYEKWWLLWCTRPEMRKALKPLKRYIGTARNGKHRLFQWFNLQILPDSQVVVIARDDDTTFGIMHSRFHELWALQLCTWLGVGNDPRYTPSTTFETFPFPIGLTPNIPAIDYADNPHAQKIAIAARRLCELRDNWLNPSDLVKHVPEVVPGYPDRILPRDNAAASVLKKRTLTNLYNERPAWLTNAHHDLDVAVAGAYGWLHDLSDDEILNRLLILNQERA